MPPRASPTSIISPLRVPRTIRAVNSGVSLCSAITLDDALEGTTSARRRKEAARSLSPIPTPPQEFRKRASRRQSEGASALRSRNDRLSQSEHHDRPFHRMELDTSSHRDSPPNQKILMRRCTEPLNMAAREACLQDLGYSEDGRKTMLVNRFAPPRTYEEDSSFESTVLIPLKSSSDESHASMPLKMPIRKASMEEIQLKLCNWSKPLQASGKVLAGF